MNTVFKKKTFISCLLFICLFSVLNFRLIYIVLFRGKDLDKKAKSYYEYKEVIKAPRGDILDRNGELLARNQTVFTLFADLSHIRKSNISSIPLAYKEGISQSSIIKKYSSKEIIEEYCIYLANFLSKISYINSKISSNYIMSKLYNLDIKEFVISKQIDRQDARDLNNLIKEKKLKGLSLRPNHTRYYLNPLSMTQVIGFIDSKGDGKSGVEKVFDSNLKGIDGFRFCERDRKSIEIRAYRKNQKKEIKGDDIYLTIDSRIQDIVEKELDEVVKKYNPKKITSIWINPKNSNILAMSNRPHFNLQNREGVNGVNAVRKNIAITDVYQPGSTFKLIAYSSIFDKKIAKHDTKVDCKMGLYKENNITINDERPYGVIDAKLAFAKSSNIGSYLLTKPLGKDVFHDYIKKFRFGKKTSIELSAESSGILKPLNKWSSTSFHSHIMGYEISVTPLQILLAYSAIANNGVYIAPTIIKKIISNKYDFPTSEIKKNNKRHRIISQRAAKEVTICMEEVMKPHGTGKNAKIEGYSMAGKTGTSRKHFENKGYVKGKYVVSFVGFFPTKKPKVVGIVVIDDPKAKKNISAGSIAAPIFKNISKGIIKVLEIKRDEFE